MKKKLLFVIDSLNSGGAEKSLISLLSMIDYDKYEVKLLLFKKEGLYLSLIPKNVKLLEIPKYFIYDEVKKKKRDMRIEIARLKNSILIRNPLYKKKYHGAQITCRNILNTLEVRSDEYDVAIAYSQGLPTYYVAEKVVASKKICWVNTDYKKAGYNKEFDYEFYKKIHNIVAVSQKSKQILENIYPEFKEKIEVIYDIICSKLVKEMAEKGSGYNDNFKGRRILTIGRHVHLKGYDMAIDVAKLLKEDNIDFRWYSIGEGPLTSELKNRVKENGLEENFVFLGTYTNPYPFIKECDIYCQPSRFEGFGMAIAEARILNKVIVATNFEIVHDQVVNNKNGIIADMNAQSIYVSIRKIIEQSDISGILINNISKENMHVENGIEKLYKLIN